MNTTRKIQRALLLIVFFVSQVIAGQNKELFLKEQFIHDNDTLNYRILFPKNFDQSKKYPMMLFLHGAGERGSNNESQLVHGSKIFLDEQNRNSFPAIVVFPQCPKKDYWAQVDVNRDVQPFTFDYNLDKGPTRSLKLVMDLVNSFASKAFVDTSKMFVGGLSMGGMGTYEILFRMPETFAAAFAICGGGDPKGAEKYANKTNLWIFHGSIDDIVAPQLSLDMAKSILDNGGNPNITFYAKDNHNSWDSAFAEPNLIPWLFSNSK